MELMDLTESLTSTESKKITKIEGNEPNRLKKKLKVAAYCRVSTDSDEQHISLEAQKAHYEKIIRDNAEWEYAGVYYDATVIIGLKQNPTNGRRFSPIFLLYRVFCGAKHRMPL